MSSSDGIDPGGNLTDRVLEALQPAVADALRAYMQASTSVSSLRDELNKYRRTVEQEAENDYFPDRVLADELVERCRRLLDKTSVEPDSEVATLARAAVLYVVSCDDAKSDIMSLVGQDDDLEVVRAVERVIEQGSTEQ